MDRVQADYTGMLGTVMNAFNGRFIATSWRRYACATAIARQQVAEPYVRGRALRHL